MKFQQHLSRHTLLGKYFDLLSLFFILLPWINEEKARVVSHFTQFGKSWKPDAGRALLANLPIRMFLSPEHGASTNVPGSCGAGLDHGNISPTGSYF